MVLLAIRALGKSKALLNQLPKSQRRALLLGQQLYRVTFPVQHDSFHDRRPERAVLYLMEFHENVIALAVNSRSQAAAHLFYAKPTHPHTGLEVVPSATRLDEDGLRRVRKVGAFEQNPARQLEFRRS